MVDARDCVSKLRRLVEEPGYETYACRVTAVDGATCKVERIIDDKAVSDVRLNATVKLGDGLVVTPKVGSVVLITNIDGDKNFVSQFSEVEKVEFKDVHGFELVVEDGKVSVKNNGYNLRKAFDDLLDAIGRLTVPTGAGPSGTPINIMEFEGVRKNLNNFLIL